MTDSMRSITIEIPIPVAQKLNETFEGTLEDATRAGLRLIHGIGKPAYTTLLELAQQLDTTPAKAVRAAIQLLVTDAARLQMTHGTVGRPKINQTRDAQLYERIKSGLTQAEVGAEFSLSIVRVGQIVAQQRAVSGDAPRRGRSRSSNLRKTLGGPNLMRMYDEIDAGMSYEDAAHSYELDEQRVRDLHGAYTAHLADKLKITGYDKMQAAHQATLTPEARLASRAEAQLQAAEIAALSTQAHAKALEAQAAAAEAKVLTLKDSPTAPRKLAVIPPSMRNPELFAALKPIEPVDFENLDNRIFSDDFEF